MPGTQACWPPEVSADYQHLRLTHVDGASRLPQSLDFSKAAVERDAETVLTLTPGG